MRSPTSAAPPSPDSLDAFRHLVVAHENRHETSLNERIDAVNTDGRLGKIEAIVGKTEGDARDQAKTLWTGGLVGKLLKAAETAQGIDTARVWNWREKRNWWFGAVTKSHDGTEGCPRDLSEQ